jgi:hypothetical protein
MSPLEVAIFVSVIVVDVALLSTSRRRQHGRSGELTRGGAPPRCEPERAG